MRKPTKFRVFSRLLSILIGGLFAFGPIGASASSPDVYWSGFAFQGDFESGQSRYPISSQLALVPEGEASPLDVALRSNVAGVANASFNIVVNDLGRLGSDSPSSIALAFVLDREMVSVEQFGREYKLLVELSAQALFFDFKESSVLASYPITLQYVHVLNHAPSDDDARQIVEALYLGGLEINAFTEFEAALEAVDLNLSVNRRIQVTKVSVASDVAAQLPPKWKGRVNDFGASLAQEFSRSLSTNQNVPVLPYSKGYAIGNRMATRFADGSVYTLQLPEPDYTISLSLKKVVKIEYEKVPAGTSFVYGTYLEVQAEEPLSGRVYMDEIIKNGATKVVPAGQTSVDDWPAYQDSLSGLIEQFTVELGAPNRKWAKKHIGDPSAVDGLLRFSKVVSSCR